MSEQVVVDSLHFARNGETLRGKVAVAELSRLVDVLYSDKGMLEYTLSGGINQHGKPVLHTHVKGELQLCCQRCMEAMVYGLDSRSDLVLARDETELAQMDEQEEDGEDAILADPKLNVLALVEDEVLLDLPMVPRHASGKCQPKNADKLDGVENNPFAVLAKLKQEQKD